MSLTERWSLGRAIAFFAVSVLSGALLWRACALRSSEIALLPEGVSEQPGGRTKDDEELRTGTAPDRSAIEEPSRDRNADVGEQAKPALHPPLRIRTVDEDGAPVAGLELHVSADGREELLGSSDVHGSLDFEPPSCWNEGIEAFFFWVDSSQYVGRSNTLAPGCSGEALVTAQRRGWIAGVVLLPDGRPAGQGVRVVAYDSRSAFPQGEEVAENGRNHARSVASTGDDGRFQLEGLTRGGRYTLNAGGRGLLMKEVRRSVPEGTADLELRVAGDTRSSCGSWTLPVPSPRPATSGRRASALSKTDPVSWNACGNRRMSRCPRGCRREWNRRRHPHIAWPSSAAIHDSERSARSNSKLRFLDTLRSL